MTTTTCRHCQSPDHNSIGHDTTITLGAQVRRVQGRTADIGRTGVVTAMSDPNIVGTGGDTLVQVQQSDGTTFQCYARQLVSDAV